MADENNQDMSMEDILSSIKNILEEDQASAQPELEPEPKPAADEDVLDLTADMRLPQAEETIDLDAELDGMKVPELSSATEAPAELSAAPEAEPEEPRGVSVGWEDFESDPFYEEPAEQPTEDSVPAAEVAAEEAELSEPETIAENEPELEPEPTAEIVEPEPETITPEPEPEVVPEPIVESEPVSEPEPVIKPEPEPELEPEPEPVVETTVEPVAEAKADSAVDVSANIISNFAKMFSKEEPAPEPVAQPVALSEPIIALGDGGKTIEEVVASVIRQIIGEEVAAHWREGVDYNSLAREEIASQTKQWLDNNLPTIVEKIVKQEIERVMAKVGNNQ